MYFISIPIVVGMILGIYVVSDLVEDPVNDQALLTNEYLTNNGSPKNGFDDAVISIVEFGDYQCTFCYKFHQNTLNAIKIQYIDTGKVSFVYRDFPLNGRDSILAAEASYCADDQDMYWSYHFMLFNMQKEIDDGWADRESLNSYAFNLGLDLDEFRECMDSSKYQDRVQSNYDEGVTQGVISTPTFLIILPSNFISSDPGSM